MDFDKITRTFTFEKSTKHTIRYAEDPIQGEIKAVGTIYLQKTLVDDPINPPETIEMTITITG